MFKTLKTVVSSNITDVDKISNDLQSTYTHYGMVD